MNIPTPIVLAKTHVYGCDCGRVKGVTDSRCYDLRFALDTYMRTLDTELARLRQADAMTTLRYLPFEAVEAQLDAAHEAIRLAYTMIQSRTNFDGCPDYTQWLAHPAVRAAWGEEKG